ncbi:hypothetical protein PR048_022214 [Dryococelus australis]|uniref:Uncharacterized protein n=1 Tax=Dryococelus australis TaxID=614101 RepID=A0ABQ9H0E8_9NEOP|nr:hypothetical protein PR048_022214 [Dryococelus australis]
MLRCAVLNCAAQSREVCHKVLLLLPFQFFIVPYGRSHDALNKIDVQHAYTAATFAIGSQLIRNALDDSEPIAFLQGNKQRVPYRQVWSWLLSGTAFNEQTPEARVYAGLWSLANRLREWALCLIGYRCFESFPLVRLPAGKLTTGRWLTNGAPYTLLVDGAILRACAAGIRIGKFREFNDLLVRLPSPVHTRASDVCSLAAAPKSSPCYSNSDSMALATCFLVSLLFAQGRPGRVTHSSGFVPRGRVGQRNEFQCLESPRGRNEVSMDRRWNDTAGDTGDLRENPVTNGIARHESHMRKSAPGNLLANQEAQPIGNLLQHAVANQAQDPFPETHVANQRIDTLTSKGPPCYLVYLYLKAVHDKTAQSSAYWSLSCVFIGCCPTPGNYGIGKVFPYKSAIGSEAGRAGLINWDPIAKARRMPADGTPSSLDVLLVQCHDDKDLVRHVSSHSIRRTRPAWRSLFRSAQVFAPLLRNMLVLPQSG